MSRTLEYSIEDARIIAMLFQYMEDKSCGVDEDKANQFLQTCSLKAGLRKFKEKGKEATMKEMGQLDERIVYVPIDIESMTDTEKKEQWKVSYSWLRNVTRQSKQGCVPMAARNVNTRNVTTHQAQR